MSATRPIRFHILPALLAVAGVMAGPLPAAAFDAAKLPAARIAAMAFASAAQNSENTGNAPRETDPAVRRLLEAAFDVSDLVDGQSIPSDVVAALSDRMTAGMKVGVIYMLAGTGVSDFSQIGAVPDVANKVNLNVVKFAPEMGRFFDFQLRTEGAIVDAVLDRLATATPEELARPKLQNAVAHVRHGSAQSVSGMIETLAISGLSDEWRRQRMPAVLAMGPRLAKFLQADQKQQLKERALAYAGELTDPQVKGDLQTFARMIGGG